MHIHPQNQSYVCLNFFHSYDFPPSQSRIIKIEIVILRFWDFPFCIHIRLISYVFSHLFGENAKYRISMFSRFLSSLLSIAINSGEFLSKLLLDLNSSITEIFFQVWLSMFKLLKVIWSPFLLETFCWTSSGPGFCFIPDIFRIRFGLPKFSRGFGSLGNFHFHFDQR